MAASPTDRSRCVETIARPPDDRCRAMAASSRFVEAASSETEGSSKSQIGRGAARRRARPSLRACPWERSGRPVFRQIEEIEGVESGLRSFEVAPAAIVALPEAHIFDDGQPRLNPVRMTDIVQEAFSACVAFGAANPHAARRRTQIAGNRTKQGGFPCAVRAAQDELHSGAHLDDTGSTTMRPPRWQVSPSTAIAVTAVAREGDAPERANGSDLSKLNFASVGRRTDFMLVRGRQQDTISHAVRRYSPWHPAPRLFELPLPQNIQSRRQRLRVLLVARCRSERASRHRRVALLAEGASGKPSAVRGRPHRRRRTIFARWRNGFCKKARRAKSRSVRPASSRRILRRVPAVVDLAAMRDAMAGLRGDTAKIESARPCRSRHRRFRDGGQLRQSARVRDQRGSRISAQQRALRVLRWGATRSPTSASCRPAPGSAIRLTWNISRQTVWTKDEGGVTQAFPDTLVGTDSHTTMVNALSLLGWESAASRQRRRCSDSRYPW